MNIHMGFITLSIILCIYGVVNGNYWNLGWSAVALYALGNYVEDKLRCSNFDY